MPRPQDNRIVHEPPLFSEFKPTGVQGRNLEQILLTLDEFEAFRLADSLGLSHAEAGDENGNLTFHIYQAYRKGQEKDC